MIGQEPETVDEAIRGIWTKIDSMDRRFSDDLTTIKLHTEKTNGRVSWLENKFWFILGAIAALGLANVPTYLEVLT